MRERDIYVYMCMRVRVYVSMRVWVCTYVRVCMRVCVYACRACGDAMRA